MKSEVIIQSNVGFQKLDSRSRKKSGILIGNSLVWRARMAGKLKKNLSGRTAFRIQTPSKARIKMWIELTVDSVSRVISLTSTMPLSWTWEEIFLRMRAVWRSTFAAMTAGDGGRGICAGLRIAGGRPGVRAALRVLVVIMAGSESLLDRSPSLESPTLLDSFNHWFSSLVTRRYVLTKANL